MQRAPARGQVPLDAMTPLTQAQPLGIGLVTAAEWHGCHCKHPPHPCLPAAAPHGTRRMHLGVRSVGAVRERVP